MNEMNEMNKQTDNTQQPRREFKDLDKDTQRFYNLLHMIFNICKLAGFKLEGRICLRDMKTGKVWE